MGPLEDGVTSSAITVTTAGPASFVKCAVAPASAYREKLVLLVQPHALVCLNKYPFAASHLLGRPAAARPGPRGAVGRRVRCVDEPAARGGGAAERASRSPQGVNVGFNLGKAAGAGIAEHLHAHIVPRWNGDTNFMPVLADVRVMPEYLDESWQRLAPAFADLPGLHADVAPVAPCRWKRYGSSPSRVSRAERARRGRGDHRGARGDVAVRAGAWSSRTC